MAIATSRCTQATATIFLSSLRETSARKRRCIAGGYLEGMPIPARSIPTRVGGKSLSTGTSTELHTHGQEAALLAPTLIRGDRTQRGKCCVSSLSIRSHKSQVRGSPVEMGISRVGDLTAHPSLAPEWKWSVCGGDRGLTSPADFAQPPGPFSRQYRIQPERHQRESYSQP